MPSDDELAVADGVGSALIRLVRLIERKRDRYQAENPDAVERAAYHLLAHLVQGGPRRASALAEAVHSDPSTVSRQVGRPGAAGLRRAHRRSARTGGRPCSPPPTRGAGCSRRTGRPATSTWPSCCRPGRRPTGWRCGSCSVASPTDLENLDRARNPAPGDHTAGERLTGARPSGEAVPAR